MLWRQLSPNVQCSGSTMEWHSVQKGCIITNERIIWSSSSENPRGDFPLLQDGEGCNTPHHTLQRMGSGNVMEQKLRQKQKMGLGIGRVPERVSFLCCLKGLGVNYSIYSPFSTQLTTKGSLDIAVPKGREQKILQKELRSGRNPRSDGQEPCSKAEEESNSTLKKPKNLKTLQPKLIQPKTMILCTRAKSAFPAQHIFYFAGFSLIDCFLFF